MLFLRLRAAVVDGRPVAGRALPAGDLAHPLCRGLPPVRAGTATELAQALVDRGAAVPEGRRPRRPRAGSPAGRRRSRGGHRRAPVPGRGRRAGGGGAFRPWPPGGPGARFLPALRRGNVQGALDMGLAPGLLPGRVGLDAGRAWFSRGLGGGARAARPGHGRHPRRRRRRPPGQRTGRRTQRRSERGHPGPNPRAPRRRSAERLPRPGLGRTRPRRGRAGRGGGLVARAGHRSGPTWCCRQPRPTSGAAPPPTWRAGSAGWPRSWSRPASPGLTG